MLCVSNAGTVQGTGDGPGPGAQVQRRGKRGEMEGRECSRQDPEGRCPGLGD